MVKQLGLGNKTKIMINNEKSCSRKEIEAACAKFKVEGKGWINPRPKSISQFKPTPELVHGVTVSSPALAKYLRSVGVFSGY